MTTAQRERFEGDFVESADLMHGPPVTLEIASVIKPGTEKAANGRLIDRPIVVFAKAQKRFILSKTNERCIKAMYGGKPAEWVGKELTLSVRYLKEAFGQKNVPTIRVVLPDSVAMPHGAWKHYGSEKPHGK